MPNPWTDVYEKTRDYWFDWTLMGAYIEATHRVKNFQQFLIHTHVGDWPEAVRVHALAVEEEEPFVPPRHHCSRDEYVTPARGYGAAIEDCKEDEHGFFWVDNGEYGSAVDFCPFCGVQAPRLAMETNDFRDPNRQDLFKGD